MRVMFAAPETAWGGILARFRAALPEVEFVATGFNPTSLAGFEVVIPTMSQLDADLIAGADRLQLIQQMGAGLEGVDLDAAQRASVAVANVPTADSGNADSVSELAIYLILALLRRAPEHATTLAAGLMGQPTGISLMGQRVGLVGFGAIGQAIARRLAPFGVTLSAIKRTSDDALANTFGLEWLGGTEDLPRLLAESDIVILALPDDSASHGLMNAERLAQMPTGSYLINVGRGGLVERDALFTALQSGQLAGAGLDVFWQEPPDPDDPIFQLNLVASPHLGGLTDRSVTGILNASVANIRRLMQGEALQHRAV
ncbi:lactate dehydrogenase [Saccharospirillum sp. MSK14-1]|uniref:2-hydroxyacid dehydrogenase n=1 Tax=Saccharospirillum sp. MSK14-1 TaxID=1897632 RepID=UPI000D3C8C76|nr:2-hydroxyacid dehydrogenase [Saccharospirillum sp. MSK14-1]PTY37219.1 lactate dehydrogenase [Saccharospirillum sp. MSK14-1]